MGVREREGERERANVTLGRPHQVGFFAQGRGQDVPARACRPCKYEGGSCGKKRDPYGKKRFIEQRGLYVNKRFINGSIRQETVHLIVYMAMSLSAYFLKGKEDSGFGSRPSARVSALKIQRGFILQAVYTASRVYTAGVYTATVHLTVCMAMSLSASFSRYEWISGFGFEV